MASFHYFNRTIQTFNISRYIFQHSVTNWIACKAKQRMRNVLQRSSKNLRCQIKTIFYVVLSEITKSFPGGYRRGIWYERNANGPHTEGTCLYNICLLAGCSPTLEGDSRVKTDEGRRHWNHTMLHSNSGSATLSTLCNLFKYLVSSSKYGIIISERWRVVLRIR